MDRPERGGRRRQTKGRVLMRRQKLLAVLGSLLVALLPLLAYKHFSRAMPSARKGVEAGSLSTRFRQGAGWAATEAAGDHAAIAAIMSRGRRIAEAVYATEDAAKEAARAAAAEALSEEAGAIFSLVDLLPEPEPPGVALEAPATAEEPAPPAIEMRSNTAWQPLYKEERGAFSPTQFKAMQEALDAHPLLHRANELDATNFGLSSGWAIQFNNEGADRISKSPLFKAIWPYFERVRLKNANSFTWNILLSETEGVSLTPGTSDDIKATAGQHTDDTLALRDIRTAHNSFETDVLYMRIPTDMSGGLLEIWGQNATAAELQAGALVRIQPEVNTLVRFRGDATHQVLKHFSESGQRRISSVIEQYIVPEELYNYTVEFEVFGQRTHSKDLKLFWDVGWLPHGPDSEGDQVEPPA